MKEASTRTLIAIDESLFTDIIETLNNCRTELEKGRQREAALALEVERNKPISEAQAAAYLGKDTDTLRYYRTLGLDSFKKGGSRWYTKGIIDDWLNSGKVTQQQRKR